MRMYVCQHALLIAEIELLYPRSPPLFYKHLQILTVYLHISDYSFSLMQGKATQFDFGFPAESIHDIAEQHQWRNNYHCADAIVA